MQVLVATGEDGEEIMPFKLGSKKAVDSVVEVFKQLCGDRRGGVCKQLCGDGVGAFSKRKNAQGIRTTRLRILART